MTRGGRRKQWANSRFCFHWAGKAADATVMKVMMGMAGGGRRRRRRLVAAATFLRRTPAATVAAQVVAQGKRATRYIR